MQTAPACVEANRTAELDRIPQEQVTDVIHVAEEAARKAPHAMEEEYRRVDALPDGPAKDEETRKLAKADADALRKALLMPAVRHLPERSMPVTLASDSRVLT